MPPSPESAEALAARLADVDARIAAAAAEAGRDPAGLTRIVVTKFHPAALVEALYALGVRDVGENRQQEFSAKVDAVDAAYFEREIRPLLDDPLVEYIGEIGEAGKSALLGGASALLFPIDWPEPFGLVMIESLACGTPVVAFRGGSVIEVLEHGVTGFVVDSIDEAIRAVRRLRPVSFSLECEPRSRPRPGSVASARKPNESRRRSRHGCQKYDSHSSQSSLGMKSSGLSFRETLCVRYVPRKGGRSWPSWSWCRLAGLGAGVGKRCRRSCGQPGTPCTPQH